MQLIYIYKWIGNRSPRHCHSG